jgi:uncharacterized membrane protein YqhA
MIFKTILSLIRCKSVYFLDEILFCNNIPETVVTLQAAIEMQSGFQDQAMATESQ